MLLKISKPIELDLGSVPWGLIAKTLGPKTKWHPAPVSLESERSSSRSGEDIEDGWQRVIPIHEASYVLGSNEELEERE